MDLKTLSGECFGKNVKNNIINYKKGKVFKMKNKALKFGDIKKFCIPSNDSIMEHETQEVIGVVIDCFQNKIKIAGINGNQKDFNYMVLPKSTLEYRRVKIGEMARERLTEIAEMYRRLEDNRNLLQYEFYDYISSKISAKARQKLFENGYILDNGNLNFYSIPKKKAFVIEGNLLTNIQANKEMDFIGLKDEVLEELYIKNKNTKQYKEVMKRSEKDALTVSEVSKEDFRVINMFDLSIRGLDISQFEEFLLKHRMVFRFRDYSFKLKNARKIAEHLNKNIS
jgi:hypothetical protein